MSVLPITSRYTRLLLVPMALAVMVTSARAQELGFDPDASYRVAVEGAPSRGPEDALVTLVEYSDFACPYCRRAQDTLELLRHLFPDELRVVFRHNPLDEVDGTLTSEASMAAQEEGMFWPMHDRIFAAGGLVSRAQLEGFAMELGLDMARFRGALDDGRFRERVRDDARDASELGIRSTPMFFINGRPIRGALPLSVFVARVRDELERARGLVARGVPRSQVYATLMASARAHADTPGSDRIPRPKLDDTRSYQVGLGSPGHDLGPADALVTVVVFSDFQCPYCQKMAPVLYALLKEYEGRLRLVFRHHPLSFHPDAQLASEAAAAAANQGRFWPMHDLLYQHQDRLTRADLDEYARSAGLDMDRFAVEMDEHRYANQVHTDRALGSALGVSGTPTLFVNGVPVGGARSYDYLKHVYIEPALASARTLIDAGVAPEDVYAVAIRMRSGIDPKAERQALPDLAPTDGLLERETYRDLVVSCRGRDAEHATELYDQLESDGERDEAREHCAPYGVDLAR